MGHAVNDGAGQEGGTGEGQLRGHALLTASRPVALIIESRDRRGSDTIGVLTESMRFPNVGVLEMWEQCSRQLLAAGAGSPMGGKPGWSIIRYPLGFFC
jgi:hypothetical protein